MSLLRLGAGLLLLAGCFASDSEFYESCDDTDDCLAGATCWRIAHRPGATGQMCTETCETDADCPGNAACLGLAGSDSEPSLCYLRCNPGCSGGFACADAIRDGVVVDQVCVP